MGAMQIASERKANPRHLNNKKIRQLSDITSDIDDRIGIRGEARNAVIQGE